ncbi:hypothetical protein C2G38_2152095 [Gigaspora rosea]|uniref:Uncharacterized protein n=1 Tax=Gigaspora rosea TaxID=44941 RepID=A0A397W7G6_9GLOM|nr:hypothetical protein C2G38_2152095 [Gigaspora rosea]
MKESTTEGSTTEERSQKEALQKEVLQKEILQKEVHQLDHTNDKSNTNKEKTPERMTSMSYCELMQQVPNKKCLFGPNTILEYQRLKSFVVAGLDSFCWFGN